MHKKKIIDKFFLKKKKKNCGGPIEICRDNGVLWTSGKGPPMDYGDHDTVHHAYEVFLVKYTNNIYQAESNFLRRLRFLCVPRDFLQTNEGKELQKISQRIAFLSGNETGSDQPSDVNGMKINQYRARTAYHSAGESSLENEWPYWLYKVNAGKLQEARTLVQKWVKLTNPSLLPLFFFFFFYYVSVKHFVAFLYNAICTESNTEIKKIEYSYQEIEERCWKIMHETDGALGGTGKVHTIQGGEVGATRKRKRQKNTDDENDDDEKDAANDDTDDNDHK
ncbi:hypothetical protein RFI_18740, partial [Reticulomyxa filosa]